MFQLQQLNETLSGIKEMQTENFRIQDHLNESVDSLKRQMSMSTDQLLQLGETNTGLRNDIQHLNNSVEMVKLGQEKSNITIQALLSQIEIGQVQTLPVSSCAALIALSPSSPSGYYWVRASNGSAVRVYCDMTRLCGGVTGGWMRVAELDMTNRSHQCPRELMQQTTTNGRTCRMRSYFARCSLDIVYSTISEYSKVCGKIRGFQTGTPDSFANSAHDGLEGNYVDGVSLTHGHPRQHIWTFAAYKVFMQPFNHQFH